MSVAYIGIGSNLDDPPAQVRSAMDAIDRADGLEVIARSSLYSSPPMGPPDQPHYINAAIAVHTNLSSLELLESLQAIEQAHGRTRDGIHWGPRTLDLDLLLHGDEHIDGPRLRLPHPGLRDRDFVILPLFEIAPGLILPDGEPLRQCAQRFATSASAVRLEDA